MRISQIILSWLILGALYFAIAELALVAVYLERYWSGERIAASFWVLTAAMAFVGLVFAAPALIKNIKQRHRGL